MKYNCESMKFFRLLVSKNTYIFVRKFINLQMMDN
jgi:hypothetical protein